MLSISPLLFCLPFLFSLLHVASGQAAPGAEPEVPNLTNCRLIPVFAGITPSDEARFTALVTTPSNAPVPDRGVTFTVTHGPSYGTSVSTPTDPNGNAVFVFQGSNNPGDVEQLTATFVDENGTVRSCGISTLYVHAVQGGSIPTPDLFVVPTGPNACAAAPVVAAQTAPADILTVTPASAPPPAAALGLTTSSYDSASSTATDSSSDSNSAATLIPVDAPTSAFSVDSSTAGQPAASSDVSIFSLTSDSSSAPDVSFVVQALVEPSGAGSDASAPLSSLAVAVADSSTAVASDASFSSSDQSVAVDSFTAAPTDSGFSSSADQSAATPVVSSNNSSSTGGDASALQAPPAAASFDFSSTADDSMQTSASPSTYPPEWHASAWVPPSTDWTFYSWDSWQPITSGAWPVWAHHLADQWEEDANSNWAIKRSTEYWIWTTNGQWVETDNWSPSTSSSKLILRRLAQIRG